jgi:hypothetical protein
MFKKYILSVVCLFVIITHAQYVYAGRCEFEGVLGHCSDSKRSEHWDCVQLGQIRWVCWTQGGNVWTTDCPECEGKNPNQDDNFEVVNISKNKCVLRFPGGKCYCLTDRKFSLCECCIDECEVISFSSDNICKFE